MADKELRKMNRTELIEIIYALQQNERTLRAENKKLQKQLNDRMLRLEKAGSIAEAALSLNHVFEDAQNAAVQYLDSLQSASESAEQIVEEAQRKADKMLASAQEQVHQTEEECQAMRRDAVQDVERQKEAFIRSVRMVLDKNSELTARLQEELDG
ncbi:MAG: hypothetical protein LUD73_05070 [Lachnospiraceae bacterium]|nr:hypothetical protein [Lachnospiraceae bacterium]